MGQQCILISCLTPRQSGLIIVWVWEDGLGVITHPCVHLYAHVTEVYDVFWHPPVLGVGVGGNSGVQAVLLVPTLINPDNKARLLNTLYIYK